MEVLIPLLAILFLFGGPVIIIIFVIRQKGRERMEMIKRGMNPVLYNHASAPKVGSGDLKAGMIITAIGIALMLSATVLQRYYDRDLMVAAVIVSFVGISILAFWWVTRKERARVQEIYERQLEKLADHYINDGTSSVTSE